MSDILKVEKVRKAFGKEVVLTLNNKKKFMNLAKLLGSDKCSYESLNHGYSLLA